jgi:NADH-quinone oxidoreductase subunit H
LHTAAPCALFSLDEFLRNSIWRFHCRWAAIELRVLELNVGLLLLCHMSLGIYGTSCRFFLQQQVRFLGGLRASSQMISYEITMGATLVGLLMIFGTLDLGEINRAQGGLLWGWLPKWGIIFQPLGFLLFVTAGIAETKRIPFDLPEGESEIIATEYAEVRRFMTFRRDDLTLRSSRLVFRGCRLPFCSDGFHLP